MEDCNLLSDRWIQRLIFILLTALALTASGFAQSGKTQTPPPPAIDLRNGVSFEISPHTGAMGGSGMFGMRLSMNYSALNMEVAAAQAIGESANLYPITLNFLLNLSTSGRLLPYGLVGGGLFMTVPTNAIGTGTVSTMGVNFGGGARFYLNNTFGFRLEAKQYLTNVTNELESRDELFIFQEISVGVTFMFR